MNGRKILKKLHEKAEVDSTMTGSLDLTNDVLPSGLLYVISFFSMAAIIVFLILGHLWI